MTGVLILLTSGRKEVSLTNGTSMHIFYMKKDEAGLLPYATCKN
jgi:hypothetical protein